MIAESAPARRGHERGLDGIRALAIGSVMVMHFAEGYQPVTEGDWFVLKVMRSGWVGLDLFFALSGYLITGILWETRGAEGYLSAFYGRRALRILPIYYGGLLVLLTVVTQVDAVPIGDAWQLVHVQGWYWGYLVNALIAQTGRWDAAPFQTRHLWSLSVEEQFYLFWPWIVARLGRRTLLRISLAAVVASSAARVAGLMLGVDALQLYVLTPFRLDGLALGAFVALAVRGDGGRRWLERWAPAIGVVACLPILPMAWIEGQLDASDRPIITLGLTCVAVASAALVATCATRPAGRATRLLELRPLRFVGRYSYAIYVFHLPLGVALRRAGFTPSLFARHLHSMALGGLAFAGCAASLAVAAGFSSWHLYEKWFLRLKDRYFPVRFPAGAAGPDHEPKGSPP